MLVYDGSDEVRIPPQMGAPRCDQMNGTPLERLAELAGRVCYDSLGKGRSSREFHEHIAQVKHYSVYEHCAFTIQLDRSSIHWSQLFNRPGLWVNWDLGSTQYRLTLNPRVLIDWDRHASPLDGIHNAQEYGAYGMASKRLWPAHLLPQVVGGGADAYAFCGHVVEPKTEDECWISLYLVGSRGFSHEQVRHGDWTAISQRSTRYCDESESPWCLHPLLKEFFSSYLPRGWEDDSSLDDKLLCHVKDAKLRSQNLYDDLVETMQPWLEQSKGLNKLDARKQARGAARGFLGNALQTEMIFSASARQWKWMVSQRNSPAADGEIRQIYQEQVIPSLKASRYSEAFKGL